MRDYALPPITDDLKRYFRFGMTNAWISNKTGIPEHLLGKMLRDGLAARPFNSKQTYYCNQDFFETIDTEAKAYWLGFIYADGCIVGDRGVNILLAGYERPHLEKYRAALEAEHPIEERHDTIRDKNRPIRIQHNVKVRIGCRKLVADLQNKGCHPRKSMTLTFPSFNQVPEDLVRHFIRGYFDGDGSIWTAKNRVHDKWGCSIISTKGFCTHMAGIMSVTGGPLLRDISYQPHPNFKKNGMVYLQMCSFRAMNAFKHYIYDGATTFLDRKKIKFDELPGYIESKHQSCPKAILTALRDSEQEMGTKQLVEHFHGDFTLLDIQSSLKRLTEDGLVDVVRTQGMTKFYRSEYQNPHVYEHE